MLTYKEQKYDERCGENRQNMELIRGRITYETLKKITSMNVRQANCDISISERGKFFFYRNLEGVITRDDKDSKLTRKLHLEFPWKRFLIRSSLKEFCPSIFNPERCPNESQMSDDSTTNYDKKNVSVNVSVYTPLRNWKCIVVLLRYSTQN